MPIAFSDYPPELSRVLRTAVNTIDAISGRIESGNLSVEDWQERMTAVVRRAHEQAMLEGSGLDTLTPEMEQVIDRQVGVQVEFLNNFLDDIEAGGWLPAFAARARMYGTSATAAYWHGNVISQAGKVLPLPAYPTEGTQCLSNCGCSWSIDVLEGENNFDAYWRLGKTDNCQTCTERAQQWNPIQIRDGVLI